MSAAPLPLTSFQDDVAALDRALERAPGPVVLAGHAYAGAVIAATRSDKMKALVYVAALAPDEGETVADVFYRSEPHPQAPKLAPDDHGVIYLPEAAFGAAFAQNAAAEELAVLAAVQRPISTACITVAVPRPLWKDRLTWFLLAEQVRMIVQDTQRPTTEAVQFSVSCVKRTRGCGMCVCRHLSVGGLHERASERANDQKSLRRVRTRRHPDDSQCAGRRR